MYNVEKYIVWRGKIVTITYDVVTGFWYDPQGTIIALQNPVSADPIVRCGIGVLSLPTSHPLTAACGPHDYAYNSVAYQAFHTRDEADRYLESLTALIGEGHWYGYLARPFYRISSWFGGKYWENPKTR